MPIRESSNDSGLAILILGLVGGPAFVGAGLARYKLKRMMENIPTSKVRSASMGLIELKGQASPYFEMKTPLTHTPACWWSYRIEEERRDHKGRRSWHEVANICSQYPVWLQDETGRVLVDPSGAMVDARENTFDCSHLGAEIRALGISNVSGMKTSNGLLGNLFGGLMGKRLRAHETVIEPGRPLYVIGELGNNDQHQAEKRQSFQDVIRQAKHDPKRMSQADANKDGKVDVAEWDAFRIGLEAEFLKQQEAQGQNQHRIIVKNPSAVEFPFIVSTSEEESVRGKYGWQALGLIVAGIALNAGVASTFLPQTVAMPTENLVLIWFLTGVLGLFVGFKWKKKKPRKRGMKV